MTTQTTKRTLIIVHPDGRGRAFSQSLMRKIWAALDLSDEVIIRYGDNKIQGLSVNEILVDEAQDA